MKIRKKLGALIMVLGLLSSSMVVAAADFRFVILPEQWDTNKNTAVKQNSNTYAKVDIGTVIGEKRVWAAVYDEKGIEQMSVDFAIEGSSKGTTKYPSYYITASQGKTYRLIGRDTEWEVTSASFVVSGTWTP